MTEAKIEANILAWTPASVSRQNFVPSRPECWGQRQCYEAKANIWVSASASRLRPTFYLLYITF